MAYRFLQFDAVTGHLRGSSDQVVFDDDDTPQSPPGTIVIDSKVRPEAVGAIRYDAAADTFHYPPAPSRLLTKADVVAALTPTKWADLNRYHPAAADPAFQNADVFWAVSVFHAATRPFAVDDPRVNAVLGTLVTAGAMTVAEADNLMTTLVNLAGVKDAG